MSERKIYVVGGRDDTYINWMEGICVGKMEDADLVVFTGGSDVDPSLYGKKAHPTTGSNPARDKYETAEFKKALELGKPMWGTCRGSQFLCVMAGHQLVQDKRHPYLHLIKTSDGRTLGTNSTHHQAQFIVPELADEVELLAWAIDKDGGEQLSPYNWGESYEDNLTGAKEVEIAFYKKIRAVCCQPHPEMLFPVRDEWQGEFIEYCRELIKTKLGV